MDSIQKDCLDIIKTVNLDTLKGKRVLVTGANGVLGGYIIATLHYANTVRRLGCKVTGVSLHGPSHVPRHCLPDNNLSFKRADLSKRFSIPGKFDYIFHAACYGQPAKFLEDPFSTIRLNVDATKTLLEMARRSNGTLVFFSSAEVYGDIPQAVGPVSETYAGSIDTTNPRAGYGESKRLGETLCATYARLYGVRTKILRISHFYGPGISIHHQRVIGEFIRKALMEKKITLLDAGKAIKTFGYVADAMKMIFHIALYGKEMVYHVGGKDEVSIRDLAERVGALMGVPIQLPKSLVRGGHRGIDPKFVGLKLGKVLGEMKKFSFVPLNEGLRRTIAWNRETFAKELPHD